jgi:hypothetical protein
MRNITAQTPATHPYPPYVNVSRHDDHDGVRITVRSGPKEDGSDGSVSFIDLTASEYRALLADMTKEEYAPTSFSEPT